MGQLNLTNGFYLVINRYQYYDVFNTKYKTFKKICLIF